MSINSKPHALLPEDTTRERNAAATRRPDRTRSAPAAGYDSGPIATSGEHLVSSSQPHSPSISVPVSSSAIAPSSASLTLPNPPPPLSRPPSSRRSTPAAFFTRPVRGNSNGSTSGTSFPPLFFRPDNNTTPETSLVGASGKSIPLGDGSVADRTSALRELNTNYPSPVLRHGYAKSTGAKNTTYSQPVIVRTYSGPSPSPSSSAHYRRPSSGSRHTSRVHVPLASVPNLSRVGDSSVHGSSHVPGIGEGAKDSLFNMACTKVKKGLMPWQWSMNESSHVQDDEAKLPPLEAFTYKGFLADLQANTSIRSDLDRIAEICARSRYSLSNQYDAHVAPHGSGAAFIAGMGGQSSYRTKGRKKNISSPGGPTLQAVPSDDDEASGRGQRRRRGGVGGGRRRSAAYGTLETIMSSSRSSEEDKSKKKSAAEIAEQVRGRTAQKVAEDGEESDTKSTPSGKERKKQHNPGKKGSDQDPAGNQAPKPSSTASRRSGKHSQQRQKPASFAHAMIDSNRHQSSPDRNAKSTTAPTVALLSDPALPQTSNNLLEIHTGPEVANPPNGDEGSSTIPVDDTEDFAPVDDEAPEEAEASGFLSGLGNWIPWVASTGSNDGFVAGHPSLSTGRQSPSHAEGSLRELLKTANGSRPNKGKAVDRQH